MGRRGSVLVHVLITAALVAFIAASVIRLVMMRQMAVARTISGAKAKLEAEALFHRHLASWNASGVVCSSAADLPCSPASAVEPGTCSCDCPSAGALPRVEVRGGGAPPCRITAVSTDPP